MELHFRAWLEVKGYRGVAPDEIRSLARGAYSARSEIGGDVAFDSDQVHGPATAGAYFTTTPGNKGYMLHIDAPDEKVRPRYADMPDDNYKVVQPMEPSYVSKIQRLRRRAPIKMGDMQIQQQPTVGPERDASKFLATYQRMFGRQRG